jgi:hypothetical protein
VRARQGWKRARHRGVFPWGPAPARRLEGLRARARNRAPPFNSAMKLTRPSEGGALQLIARLNGKRSLACRPSACGYGAPPPDQRPRAFSGRHCARSVRTDVSVLAPAPAAAPWLRFG